MPARYGRPCCEPKMKRSRGLALALADLLAERARADLTALAADAIVPVPTHWSRRIRRGTGSAETVAERLAQRLAIPLAGHLLTRRRRTAPQASLSVPQRRANVRRAFRAASHADLPGAQILLVDDIVTTGATADEAAKTLRKAGASFVALAVIARAEGLV